MRKLPGNNNNSNNNNNNNNNSNNSNENNNMDSSFYEENTQQFNNSNQSNTIKRPASLDLNPNKNAKKQRLNQTVPPLVLDSPGNLKDLPFNTPDILEKFLLNTPTPSNNIVVFPQAKATKEQENFSKGFVEALEKLKEGESTQQNTNPGVQNQSGQQNLSNNTTASVITTSGMSGGSITYTNLDDSFPIAAIKDEPQPASPPVSPIDMETQEKIKLERKRQRNRVAASKCRKRKLERISKLEDKVKTLKTENAELGAVVKNLKGHVFQLKQEVIDHVNFGCNISVYTNGTSMLATK